MSLPYGAPPPGGGPPPPAGAVEVVPLEPEALRIDRWNALLAKPPLTTLALILACAAIFAATAVEGEGLRTLGRFGAKVTSRIARGEVWRVVTANFLHVNLVHLMSNAVGLYVLGRLCENLFSRRVFFALYVATGVAAQSVSAAGTPAVSVGASGPIFGVLGALIAFHLRRRRDIPHMHRGALAALALWAVFSIAAGLLQPEVDNWAHGGGLAAGLILGLLVPAPALDGAPPERRRAALGAVLAAGAALVLAGSVAGAVVAARRPVALVEYRHLPGGFRIVHGVDFQRRVVAEGEAVLLEDDLGAVLCVGRLPRDALPAGAPAVTEALRACAGEPELEVGREELEESAAATTRASWRRFRRTAPEDGPAEVIQRIDLTDAGGHTWFVVAESPTDSFAAYEPAFDAVLESFELP